MCAFFVTVWTIALRKKCNNWIGMTKYIWLFFPKMFGPPPKKMERTTGYTKTSSPIPPFLNNNLSHENQLPTTTRKTLEHPHVTWGKNAKHSHLWVSFCKNCLDPAPAKNWTYWIYKTKLVKLKNLCYLLRTRPGLRGKFAMTWRDEKQVEAQKIILSVGAVDDLLGIIL